MSRVARYGKLIAREGKGEELAELLLRAAAGLQEEPGCELYLVNRQADAPDTIWVTELWRSPEALASVQDKIRGSAETGAAMALVSTAEMIELDPLGGKGPLPSPA